MLAMTYQSPMKRLRSTDATVGIGSAVLQALTISMKTIGMSLLDNRIHFPHLIYGRTTTVTGSAPNTLPGSLLVLTANKNTRVAVVIDTSMHSNWPAADLTIFDILLFIYTAINKKLDRLTAVGTRTIN